MVPSGIHSKALPGTPGVPSDHAQQTGRPPIQSIVFPVRKEGERTQCPVIP
jgi:hypothetical protein